MHADFKSNVYSISYKDGLAEASFEPLIPTTMRLNSPEMANFSSFIDANVSPWLAFPLLSSTPHQTKCASNVYNFSRSAYVRPVNMR